MNSEEPKDYKKLAEDFVKSLKVQNISEVPATLYRGDLLFATGVAAVSRDFVLFCPDTPKHLGTVLNGVINLKVISTDASIKLEHLYYSYSYTTSFTPNVNKLLN